MTGPSFAARLAALLPPPGAPEHAYPPAFASAAALVLDAATLHIAGVPHRVTEVEFYVRHAPHHADPFTHGDPMQEEFARWYFHRTAGTYRGGSYKGVDVACGAPGMPAGILLRGLARLDADPAHGHTILCDGPSLCVDYVLRATGSASVAALAASFDRAVDPPPAGSPTLALTVDPAPRGARVFASARVGLTLRRGATPERVRFLARRYRFLTEPARIRKGRALLVVGLHETGASAEEITAWTGAAPAAVRACVRAYAQGRGRDPADFAQARTSAEVCALLGACASAPRARA